MFFRFLVVCFLWLRNRLISVCLFKTTFLASFRAIWWIFCVQCVLLSIFFVILP